MSTFKTSPYSRNKLVSACASVSKSKLRTRRVLPAPSSEPELLPFSRRGDDDASPAISTTTLRCLNTIPFPSATTRAASSFTTSRNANRGGDTGRKQSRTRPKREKYSIISSRFVRKGSLPTYSGIGLTTPSAAVHARSYRPCR